MFFLPPNTSHFTQPLDDLLFAIYKTELAKLGRQLIQALWATKQKVNATQVLTAVSIFAQQIAFSPSNIVAAFVRVGLSISESGKWDSAVMLDRARANASSAFHTTNSDDDIARRAEKAVILKFQQHRDIIEKVDTSNRKVTVTVQYRTMFDSTSILAVNSAQQEVDKRKTEEKELQQVEKAAKLVAKADAKRKREEDLLIRTCRVDNCNARFTQSRNKRFMWCEHCLSFGVCPGHYYGENREAEEGRLLVSEHEEACRPNKRQRRK